MMNSTPVLVAPRPVRLNSDTSDLFSRAHHIRHSSSSPRIRTAPLESIYERNEQTTSSTGSSAATPSNVNALVGVSRQELSQSPRPEEALEEFLSIFRSTAASVSPPPTSFLFSPSPTRIRALMPYRQQGSTLFAVEEISWANGNGSPAPIQLGHDEEETGVVDSGTTLEVKPHRWFSSHLSSPISRTNTRNPFQRHPSYDIVVMPSVGSPRRSTSASSRPLSSVSPANIPLPPTPAPEA